MRGCGRCAYTYVDLPVPAFTTDMNGSVTLTPQTPPPPGAVYRVQYKKSNSQTWGDDQVLATGSTTFKWVGVPGQATLQARIRLEGDLPAGPWRTTPTLLVKDVYDHPGIGWNTGGDQDPNKITVTSSAAPPDMGPLGLYQLQVLDESGKQVSIQDWDGRPR